MKDLKSYAKYKYSNYVREEEPKNAQTDNLDKEKLEDAVNKYSNYSESQLYEELFKEVEKAKESGSISKESMSNFYDTVSPMLSDEQKEKLKGIIGKLNL